MSNDPYKSLGVEKTASTDEIKKAYRKIARTCHPDLNPEDKGAEARFKAASAAYDLLKDPEMRARFDRGEIDASGAERPERQYYRDYADAPQNPYRSGQHFDQSFDSSDIFAEFLRQQGQGRGQAGGGGQQQFRAPGPDRHYTLEVSFMDAAIGGKTRISLPDGAALAVTIPEGSADAQIIRLRGKGGAGYGGGPTGDALVTLTLQAHPVFSRDGNDIEMVLPITLDEAVLGGKVTVPTIRGSVAVNIPKGASSGQVLRLRGRGVKGIGGKSVGDQRVELRVVSPPEIDDELKDFMQSWRKTHAYDPRKGMTP